jgi:ERCC4-type nuclease
MASVQPDFTIIIDTREQQPWSFDSYAKANTKLDTGDYSIQGFENIVAIERKKSVSEFANNITESRFTDVVMRMGEIKYSFLLLEFNLEDVLIYPVGSTVPKRMWDKIKISPAFILKNLLDLELKHNISVHFCGNSGNAEKLAETIFKKVYYLERNSQNI